MENNNNEDEYINDDCLIKDENYLTFKPLIICNICNQILKNPMMCVKCQSNFCKTCIEKWSENYAKCPKNCENPNYKKNNDKIALLSLLKFKCKNCKSEVKYNDVQSHLNEGCSKNENENKLSKIIYKKKKLKKLSNDEIKNLKNNNKQINHLTSKKYFI